MELRHLTLEIFLTFSECFGEFSDLFLYKNVSNKKKMYDFFCVLFLAIASIISEENIKC